MRKVEWAYVGVRVGFKTSRLFYHAANAGEVGVHNNGK